MGGRAEMERWWKGGMVRVESEHAEGDSERIGGREGKREKKMEREMMS